MKLLKKNSAEQEGFSAELNQNENTAPSFLHEIDLPYEDALTNGANEYMEWLSKNSKRTGMPVVISCDVQEDRTIEKAIKTAVYNYAFNKDGTDNNEVDEKPGMEVHVL